MLGEGAFLTAGEFLAEPPAAAEADEDAMASMIDDLARHLLANLPDVGE